MNLNDFELSAVVRANVGSAATNKLRKEEKVPATIYGKDKEPISASFELDVLKKALASKTLFNKFTTLHVGKSKMLVMAKVVQKHPVTDRILHIDFQIVEKKDNITMRVPVRFINKEICEPIKLGGVLNVIHNTVELVGEAQKMPAYLDFDIKDAVVKKPIKISSYEFEKGVKPSSKFEQVNIATILAAKKKGGASGDEESEESSES